MPTHAPDQRALFAHTVQEHQLVSAARGRIQAAAQRLLVEPLDTQAALDLIGELHSSDTKTARAALRRLHERGKGGDGTGVVAPPGPVVRPLRRSA